MLNQKEFDLWADGYDKSVQLSEETNTYPFAGYKQVLGAIYQIIKEGNGQRILDVGFGTAVLSKKLYDEGATIVGFDFSKRMIELAQQKMPNAKLIHHDFTQGFPKALENEMFDFVVCTYAIHHLTDDQKIHLIQTLLSHVKRSGKVLIGDVAFETMEQREQCRKQVNDGWDEDEIYPVFEVLKAQFPKLQFKPISFCSGILLFEQ